ncbi:hypothetical protein C8R44DRAFT_892072 [Mycena epipterygia]|nr:hypothetical protein C8R44DRAFT_892072 [Mycena epipterygia]
MSQRTWMGMRLLSRVRVSVRPYPWSAPHARHLLAPRSATPLAAILDSDKVRPASPPRPATTATPLFAWTWTSRGKRDEDVGLPSSYHRPRTPHLRAYTSSYTYACSRTTPHTCGTPLHTPYAPCPLAHDSRAWSPCRASIPARTYHDEPVTGTPRLKSYSTCTLASSSAGAATTLMRHRARIVPTPPAVTREPGYEYSPGDS